MIQVTMPLRRLRPLLCLVVLALCVTPARAFADVTPLSPADVVAIDRGLDGTYIELEGEAIGEALRADANHAWVNVLGDGVAVGIYVSRDSSDLITTFGDHRHDGDIVRVGGVVNVACDEHAGEFDVHAETFEVLSQGSERDTPMQPWKAIVGAISLAFFLGEWRWYRHLKERSLA